MKKSLTESQVNSDPQDPLQQLVDSLSPEERLELAK